MVTKDLSGKKLLFIDGSLCVIEVIKRAKALGIKTVVANYYNVDRSPAKLYADEAVNIDFTDYEAMINMIKDKEIDGFFQGWTDSHLPVYADICELMGWPCYGTKKQFEVCINKSQFKKACRQYGVPVAKEYEAVLDDNGRLDVERIKPIEYPVITKPVDNSGSRGIYISNSDEELISNYSLSESFSASKTVLIEEYIQGQHVNTYYTFSKGKVYLSATADRYVDYLNYESAPVPVLLVHPSIYLNEFENQVHPALCKMFKGLGMKDGIAFVQGFHKEKGGFTVYEIGYRPNGGGTYALIDACSGYNQVDMLINFALTGEMGQDDILENQSPNFTKKGYMYVLSTEMKAIQTFNGLSEIEKMEDVVAVFPDRFAGEQSTGAGSHARIAAYILFTQSDRMSLQEQLNRFYDAIEIKDTEGNDMKFKKIDIPTMTIYE